MTDINTVNIIGRLVRDIDSGSFGYTAGGMARLNISIATNRSQKTGGQWVDKASFFDVTVWGKSAENIKPYLSKGKQVAIEGYLDQQRWEKDGRKYSKVCIIANAVQLLGGKDNARNTPQQAGAYSDTGNGDDFPEDIEF